MTDTLQSLLDQLRAVRDKLPHGEARSALNVACDRLDVVVSKMAAPDTTSPAEGLGPLPAPAGFRTRYRSEPGMIGHYPWTYADAGRRKGDRPECDYEDLFTADQMRAYRAEGVAAERARMDRLYDVVSRMVEQDHVVNLTRLHDYCFGEPGMSAESVDGGPAEADPDQEEAVGDLYSRLESLSKCLEGSGRIDEHQHPGAYATVLDAMNFMRSHGA
jgi:hypothetical protein